MINTDGTASYVDVPFPTPLTNISANDFSICMFLTPADITGQATFMRYFDATDDVNNFTQLTIGSTNGDLGFIVEDAGTQRGVLVDSAITVDVEIFVVCTWDASANIVTLSIDGVKQSGTPSLIHGAGTSGEFNIGRRTNGTADTHSEIGVEDFRVYDRVITQAEITTIHGSDGHDNIVDGLIGRYLMNEKSSGKVPGPETFFKAEENNIANTASLSVNVPTHVDGDGLWAFICPAGDNPPGTPANITTPSGWTLVATGDLPSTTSTPSLWIFRREASSEPASYSFVCDQTTFIAGIIASYDGTKINTTEDVVSSINTGTSSTAVAPTVTPSDNAVVLRICATDGPGLPATLANFYPSDTIGRVAIETSGDGSSNGCALGFSDFLAPTGAVGTANFTLFGSDQWGCFTLAFLGGSGDNSQDTVLDISISGNHITGIDGPTYSPSQHSFDQTIIG